MDWFSVSLNSSSNQELDEIVEELKRIAPHIRWRIQRYDYETLDGSLTYYTDLVVPGDQVQEAEEIIELWENGEDLENYSPMDRYGVVYINQDGKRILNPTVKKFQFLVREYNKLLENVRSTDVEEAIRELAKIISTIYAAALDLPKIDTDSDSEEEDFRGDIFDEKTLLDEKYNSCRDVLTELETNLGEIYAALNINNDSWYEYHYEGKSLIGELTPDGVAQMVDRWRFYFFADHDWGVGNLCLNTLRLAKTVLKQFK